MPKCFFYRDFFTLMSTFKRKHNQRIPLRYFLPSLFTFSLSFTESWPHFVYSKAPVWSHKVSLNASHIKPVRKGTLLAKELDSISFFYCLFVLRLCSSQYTRFCFAITVQSPSSKSTLAGCSLCQIMHTAIIHTIINCPSARDNAIKCVT